MDPRVAASKIKAVFENEAGGSTLRFSIAYGRALPEIKEALHGNVLLRAAVVQNVAKLYGGRINETIAMLLDYLSEDIVWRSD